MNIKKITRHGESVQKYFLLVILMDLAVFKSSFNENSSTFVQLESKLKFLSSDKLDDKQFVEQFKLFFNNHNIELLKRRMLALKGVSRQSCDNCIRLYRNVEQWTVLSLSENLIITNPLMTSPSVKNILNK